MVHVEADDSIYTCIEYEQASYIIEASGEWRAAFQAGLKRLEKAKETDGPGFFTLRPEGGSHTRRGWPGLNLPPVPKEGEPRPSGQINQMWETRGGRWVRLKAVNSQTSKNGEPDSSLHIEIHPVPLSTFKSID